jgi:hypothetical protein
MRHCPGVLRITPHVTDLNITAPDGIVNIQRFSTMPESDAHNGVRDAQPASLGQVDRGTVHELSSRINRTFSVTNAFCSTPCSRWTANHREPGIGKTIDL